MYKRIMILASLIAVQGCSSLTSSPIEDKKLGDGLTYYLPKKDVLITVVVGKASPTSPMTVTVAATDAYPDLNEQYSLKHESNPIGIVETKININERGLLQSAKAISTSNVSEALSALVESGSSVGMLQVPGDPPASVCAIGTHTFVYQIPTELSSEQKEKACGLTVRISKIFGMRAPEPTDSKETAESSAKNHGLRQSGKVDTKPYDGIYYRQAEPFLVKVSGTVVVGSRRAVVNTEKLIFSPSIAPVRSLFIGKSFFSNAETDFGFIDGMPTKYDKKTEGELVALLKLPATVLSAYFKAIGGVFEAFKARDTKEVEVLNANLQLEVIKRKVDACFKALQDGDDGALARLGCAGK